MLSPLLYRHASGSHAHVKQPLIALQASEIRWRSPTRAGSSPTRLRTGALKRPSMATPWAAQDQGQQPPNLTLDLGPDRKQLTYIPWAESRQRWALMAFC